MSSRLNGRLSRLEGRHGARPSRAAVDGVLTLLSTPCGQGLTLEDLARESFAGMVLHPGADPELSAIVRLLHPSVPIEEIQ